MFAATRLTRLRHDTSRILSHWILPLGWLALLTGMFWVGDRSDYHRLFYILLAAPTLLYVILQPRLLRPLTGSPLFIAFLAFSSYMMLSLSWSTPRTPPARCSSAPVHRPPVLLRRHPGARSSLRLKTATWLAALGAVISAAATLLQYYWDANPLRLTGYGALYNPLLSAHVYGAFTALWLAYWMQSRPILAPLPLISLALLGGLLIATGSRTPLVGLTAALMWLVLAGDRKKPSSPWHSPWLERYWATSCTRK